VAQKHAAATTRSAGLSVVGHHGATTPLKQTCFLINGHRACGYFIEKEEFEQHWLADKESKSYKAITRVQREPPGPSHLQRSKSMLHFSFLTLLLQFRSPRSEGVPSS
jgi:hypothetical protein